MDFIAAKNLAKQYGDSKWEEVEKLSQFVAAFPTDFGQMIKACLKTWVKSTSTSTKNRFQIGQAWC